MNLKRVSPAVYFDHLCRLGAPDAKDPIIRVSAFRAGRNPAMGRPGAGLCDHRSGSGGRRNA